MRYAGGKGGNGTYQTIINNIPKHRVYIEPFAGGVNILERKKKACCSIAIEIDDVQVEKIKELAIEDLIVINGDGVLFIKEYDFKGDEFLYVDPPYVMSTRKGGDVYKYEFSDDQHVDLLTALLAIGDRAKVMISGYRSPLYEAMLQEWKSLDFKSITRGGMVTDTIWMNYELRELHETTYLGGDFREREKLKRKAKRWTARFKAMSDQERQMMWGSLNAAFGDEVPDA